MINKPSNEKPFNNFNTYISFSLHAQCNVLKGLKPVGTIYCTCGSDVVNGAVPLLQGNFNGGLVFRINK